MITWKEKKTSQGFESNGCIYSLRDHNGDVPQMPFRPNVTHLSHVTPRWCLICCLIWLNMGAWMRMLGQTKQQGRASWNIFVFWWQTSLDCKLFFCCLCCHWQQLKMSDIWMTSDHCKASKFFLIFNENSNWFLIRLNHLTDLMN